MLLEEGSFDVNSLIVPEQCFGLLVLAGLIAAELEVGRARVALLLGAGDLIRPWEMGELTLTRWCRWWALTRARVVPVSDISLQPPTTNPALVQQLLARATSTSHWLLATTLILSAPSIEERLLLLFAHYGERWGKVTPQGVCLDLPLTHELLASLSGARRPTVTLALRSLTQQGLLTRVSRDRWLLKLDPETNGSGRYWKHYAEVLGLDDKPSTKVAMNGRPEATSGESRNSPTGSKCETRPRPADRDHHQPTGRTPGAPQKHDSTRSQ